MKKVLKFLLAIVFAVILLAALLIGWLTIREYKPAPEEAVEVKGSAVGGVALDEEIDFMTWNVGYCALGKDSDFVMDGGGNVPPADEKTVNKYADGVEATLRAEDADIYMLQEVDTDSTRSFGLDQTAKFALSNGAHALNYSCGFVPFPWPPMGKVNSGLFTTTDYSIDEATRISLPCPFSWPLRVANLKRCLLVSRIPVEGSDAELVVVNLHLEAYDSGEGKIAQTKQLKEFVESEYDKGNYVIAGGDWNQVFPGSLDVYPNDHPDLWAVGMLEESMLEEGWQFAYDMSSPTCRLLNQPYEPSDTENTQYYVIDGFMLSPNVELKTVETLQKNFENSDHNPVHMCVVLK